MVKTFKLSGREINIIAEALTDLTKQRTGRARRLLRNGELYNFGVMVDLAKESWELKEKLKGKK